MVAYDFSGFRSGAGEKLVLLRCYAPPQGICYTAFRSIALVLSSGGGTSNVQFTGHSNLEK